MSFIRWAKHVWSNIYPPLKKILKQIPQKLMDFFQNVSNRLQLWRHIFLVIHMGVSLNGGTPISHPKCWSFLVGKPMVVGYHHFRKPPYSIHHIFRAGTLISTVLSLFISATQGKRLLLKSRLLSWKMTRFRGAKTMYLYNYIYIYTCIFIFHDRASMWSDIFF